jgi:hypothetical protein
MYTEKSSDRNRKKRTIIRKDGAMRMNKELMVEQEKGKIGLNIYA